MFHFSLIRTELHNQKLFSSVFVFREKDDISGADIKANMRKILQEAEFCSKQSVRCEIITLLVLLASQYPVSSQYPTIS